ASQKPGQQSVQQFGVRQLAMFGWAKPAGSARSFARGSGRGGHLETPPLACALFHQSSQFLHESSQSFRCENIGAIHMTAIVLVAGFAGCDCRFRLFGDRFYLQFRHFRQSVFKRVAIRSFP
ncbi:hypothetical protein, partial [Mesorhizobium sp. M1C.F.Ca.ET.195.01.1.1]|uniref:hypothetical protein n=1 Tax=Mesorhizobium sp. M1C.F.Ca.ET.195.01.1.1 TaxID=2563927 RepID=UPI001AEE29BF